MLEYKLALAAAPTLDDGPAPGQLRGLAAAFGNVDFHGDIIAPGAFADTLDYFVQSGFLAYEHDWARRVGIIEHAHEDADGLRIVAAFHTDAASQDARTQARERLARGKSVGLSIGYEALAFSFRAPAAGEKAGPFGDKVRVLEQVQVYETSLVSVPANPAALAGSVKGAGGVLSPPRAAVEAAVAALQQLLVGPAAADDHPSADRGLAAELAALDRRLRALAQRADAAAPADLVAAHADLRAFLGCLAATQTGLDLALAAAHRSPPADWRAGLAEIAALYRGQEGG